MRRDAFRAENARRWRPYGRVPGRHRSNVARGRSGTTPKVSRGRRADRRGVRAAPRTHLALGGMRAMWPIMGRLAAVILVRSACEHVRTPIARVFVSRGLWEVGGASRIEPGPGGPPEVAASAFAEYEISMLGVLRPLKLPLGRSLRDVLVQRKADADFPLVGVLTTLTFLHIQQVTYIHDGPATNSPVPNTPRIICPWNTNGI